MRIYWAVITAALMLVGCAGAAAGPFVAGVTTLIAAFALVACTIDVPVSGASADSSAISDTGDTNDTNVPIPDRECSGDWEPCCAADGTVDTCCCPTGTDCNYSNYNICDDGSCVYASCPVADVTEPSDIIPDSPDVIEPTDLGVQSDTLSDPADLIEPTDTNPGPTDIEDVIDLQDTIAPSCDGSWQTCCIEGELSECCCPEGAICNYLYQVCDDGTCNTGPCETPDAGSAPDTPIPSKADTVKPIDNDTVEENCNGTWQTCCVDNTIDTCCCPTGVACNYGWFETCADGSCSTPGGCKSDSM
jgi:hypothetical protein